MLIRDNAEILDLIEIDDLRKAAEGRSILNIEEFLKEAGVKIRGSGDKTFVRGRDLIGACGPDCTPRHGFGEILADFVVRDEQKRVR